MLGAMRHALRFIAAASAALAGCGSSGCSTSKQQGPTAADCVYVEDGFGPAGEVPLRTEVVASGLEVPWGVAFLPDGAILVAERPGRIRRIENGRLLSDPVAAVEISAGGEGGLLGLAADPDFAANRYIYLYYTAPGGANRIERWAVAPDGRSATADRVLLDGIAASRRHDGGRLAFGPDGHLYACTGDAGTPERAQDLRDPAGKLLRVGKDGGIPADNPWPGSPAWLIGIRNCEGFDFLDDGRVILADHGPSGEFGWRGNDEVSVAQKGDNLGWPAIKGCEAREGMASPILAWRKAVPPGGGAIYRGDELPFRGDFLVGTLGSRHLHRIVLSGGRVARHEVYFDGDLGRIRTVIQGPDGGLYLATSNCDGRAECPAQGDVLVRVRAGN
jgi:glucose/arabinose dehydrogenase